jgi:ferritin-like metal-binding protein YciE
MRIATPTDIFFDQLKDLKSALEQVAGTMPELIGWSTAEDLRKRFEQYRDLIRSYLQEVLAISESHREDPRDDKCKAIAGLIEGGNQHLELAEGPVIRDLLLIAHSSRIARYLLAASRFAGGIAITCGRAVEADVITENAAAQVDFMDALESIASKDFGVEIGGAI